MPEGPDGDDFEDLRERMSNAVHGAFPGEMVTKWLVICEVLGQAGDRAVYLLSALDMKPWDTLGLTRYVETLEQARIMLDEGSEDEG